MTGGSASDACARPSLLINFDWPIKVQRTIAGRNMTATDEALRLARIAAQAAADKLAKDILLVDVSDRLAITDIFVIVTGANERQVGAIVDSIEEKMREAGTKPPRREGERDGRWVLLDFVDVVVHVQHAEERVFYALDRLWKDCPAIPFVDASGDPSSVASTSDADGDGTADATSTCSDDRADSPMRPCCWTTNLRMPNWSRPRSRRMSTRWATWCPTGPHRIRPPISCPLIR